MGAKILATNVHVHRDGEESVILEAGTKVPKWAEKLITNPAAFADPKAVDDSVDDDTSTGDYSTWKYPELKNELKKRELPQSGKLPELVQRLVEHDAELAANPVDDDSDPDQSDDGDEDTQE